MAGEDGAVSRFAFGMTPPLSAAQKEAASSAIITTLQARRSALPEGGPFDTVAAAVLDANSRTAEAELRAARLRAVAASKNWLPRIGPSISLTSLSEVVANLIVEQVLFDHGRLKAEREFAKHDVEVAAVGLADDTNARVFTALSLYLDVAEGRERATLDARTLKDMAHFEWVMQERVRGGVSDRSDLSILSQKLGEIRASQSEAQEAASAALAELNAMSSVPLNDVSGLSPVHMDAADARALSVLRAEAEKDRSVAEAKVSRAGLLPGVSASGSLGDTNDGAINVGGDLLGFGTGASLRAIEMEKDAAARRVAQAEEDASRRLSRLAQRTAALERQVGEAKALTAQAKQNLDLFQEQYEAGQRQVTDVVGVYETFAARETRSVALKFELAKSQLEIARLLGLLADGSAI
ncbi:TolC family protein [Roseovarius carneus]|uniref:TolC family protein n=1 Tax=Roseovarius carneus TaxID=2853164 RepID=UPI001CCE3008|nr:TolC family protein [Roseovarius carneus]